MDALLAAGPTLDFTMATRVHVARTASGTGFNFTQQDIDVHLAERASIPATFAIASIFPALAIIAVILRFIAARKSKAGRTIDDWVILAALVPTIASCVWMICTYTIDKTRIMKSFFAEAEKGNFTELDDPLGNANALQWGPGVVSTFYLTSLTLIKISILLLYRRLFPTETMIRTTYFAVVLMIAIWITFVVPSLMGLANAKGLSNGVIFVFILTSACINVVVDLGLLILPIPFVWQLKLTTARKMQIVGMFSLGAFCVFSSTIRLAYLADYWRKLNFIFAHEKDWYATFTLAEFAKSWWMTWIWALIEPCTSIMAACLPTLRPLVDGRGEEHTWLTKIFGALYPKTLFSRSAKYGNANSESSTKLSKVHVMVKKDVEVSAASVSPGQDISYCKIESWSQANARPEWKTSRLNLAQHEVIGDGRVGSAGATQKIQEKELV